MTGKRALIVDDSKSARVVLSRLLERHELAVDTLDSAESALVYLQENRPDVIFMDHVMPGMDGLKAVEAIKRDPSTASIPIMMYTSQDGELYAGEARALGAAGVMSKLSSPADLSQVLGHLQLLPAPAEPAPPTAPVPEAAAGPAATPTAPAWPGATEIRGIVEPLLREQGVDLRRFVVASLESFAARVISDVGSNLTAAIAAAQPPPVVVAPPPPAPAPVELPPEPPRRPLGWMLLALACLLTALAAGAYAWQQQRQRGALAARLAAESGELATVRRELAALASPPAQAEALAPASAPQRLLVPYGEIPWSGERLAVLETLLATLEQQGFAGTLRATSFAGEYCLTGNPTEGYGPAPGEMPANRCDLVGNPFDDGLGSAQRQPPTLAAVIAAARTRAHGRIDVVASDGRRAGAADGYPPTADASAAQWNQVAAARNRIEFALEPRADGG